MTTAPNRRWPRFTLRTLFVVVIPILLLTMLAALLGPLVPLVRERRELIREMKARGGGVFFATDYGDDYYRQFHLSLSRNLLGDGYVMQVTPPADATDEEIEHLDAMFPEAFIYPIRK